MRTVELLKNKLATVTTSRDFENWVRMDLRRHLPHASFLGTVGRLYGLGSILTHRVGVDFPLNMVEQQKSRSGAIDDPLMFGWFKDEKLRYLEVLPTVVDDETPRWRKSFVEYGMRNMLVHGVMDHKQRQFVTFQLGNLLDGGDQASIRLISELVAPMYEVVASTIDARAATPTQGLFGHPLVSLTRTEIEIIEYLAQGLSNKEIARRRGVSDSTIKTQVARTGAKLGANRRAEIVAIAYTILSTLPAQGLVSYGDT